MEEKREEKKIPVSVYAAGAALIFLLGRRSGYKYAKKVANKNLNKHWYQMRFNGQMIPLYFHESIRDEVGYFLDKVNNDWLELKELRALKEAAK